MNTFSMLLRAIFGFGLLTLGGVGWWSLALQYTYARAAGLTPPHDAFATTIGVLAFSAVTTAGWSIVVDVRKSVREG